MPIDIVMPNLGFDSQEARLVEWLKQVGDSVKKGDILAIIESDKANVELESVASGTLLEQFFAPESDVPVGAVIARIGQAGEMPAAQPVSPTRDISPVARRLAEDKQVNLDQIQGTGARGKITRDDVENYLVNRETPISSMRALPKVRKMAREWGIDLAQVHPTGAQGEITLADLASYHQKGLPEPTSAPRPEVAHTGREIPLSRMRQLIGKRLGESKREAPHFYVSAEIDVEAALNRLKTYAEPAPRVNDLIQYLTVQTLLQIPELNATYEQDRLYYYSEVNLAVAVAREDGLITPVLHQAEKFSLQGLASESRSLIKRTRENRLQPQDLQGGTFTISNLGVIPQVERFTAVINPPQVAILAVGTVKPRPVVVDGGLHIRHTVFLTLSGDHRVVDGMHLGRFMATFQAELERFTR